MSNNIPLSPCPFCGCTVQAITGFDYVRIKGDHAGSCVFVDDDPIIADAAEWNTRAALAEPVPPAGGEPEVLGWRVFGYNFNTEAFALDYAKWAEDVEPVLYLVDRAHFTRIQAEVEQWKRAHRLAMQDNIKLQSELTKARELLDFVVSSGGFSYATVAKDIRDFLSNQSAPADKGQGEPAPFYICIEDFNGLVRDDTAIANVRVSREKRGHFTEPLYAEQPAPVAAVMPGRKTVTPGLLSESNTYNQGWNACIDEVARLNQIKQ